MASEGMIGQGLSDMKLKTIMGGRGSEWEYNKDFL